MGPDLDTVLWRPSRTPKEVLIKREEAQELLATDQALKRRVKWAVKQYATTQAAMAGGRACSFGESSTTNHKLKGETA
jgi:hypothetical protein